MKAKMHKIEFRPIESDDLLQLQAWRNRSDVRLICREYRLLNKVMQQEWFDGLLGDRSRLTYGIVHPNVPEPHRGDLIGVCGWTFIDWRSRHALLSMYIGDEQYQQDEWYLAVLDALHYVAFDEIGMHMVRAEVYDFDPRMNIFEQAGYRQTGTRPDAYFHQGRYHDIRLFHLDESTWRDTRDA